MVPFLVRHDHCSVTRQPVGKRESEGLNAHVWFHCMSSMLSFAFNLIKCHDIVCHYYSVCCELASTFNVLTWRVMLDFRKV